MVGRADDYRAFLEQRRKDGKLPSHNRHCMPGTVKLENTLDSLSDALNIVNNNIICKHGRQSEDSAEKKEMICRVKQEYNIPDYRQMITNVLVKKERDCPEIVSEETQREGPVEQTTDTQHDLIKTEPVQSQGLVEKTTDTQHGSQWDSDTSQDSCEFLKCDTTVAYSDTEDTKINFLWDAIATSMYEAKAAVSVGGEAQCQEGAAEEDSDENVEVVERKNVLLQCPMCLRIEKSQKSCIEHISTFHPEYRYKCCYCSKEFSNFHTRYRHERDHEGPKVHCEECGEGFQFSSELACHETVHKDILPFPCNACTKRFASEKSLRRHKNVHNETSIPCEVCGKISTTPEHHYSHFHGAHGKGYTSKCGQTFQWPATRARHYESCTTCENIFAQEAAEKLKRKKKTDSGPSPKKIKAEGNTDSIAEMKQQVQMQIEKIFDLKKDL